MEEAEETKLENYNIQEILYEVSEVTYGLLIDEPFYGHFFTGLIKKVSTDIDTLAVGYHQGLVVLYINPFFWEKALAETRYKVGGIKHEILHIVYKHIFRYKNFNNKTIFNIAADLVVNQYIDRKQLIDGAVFLDNFPELELPPHEHVNAYYNALLELYQQKSSEEDQEEAEQNQSWKHLKRLLDQENMNQKRHALWKHIDELTSAERDILESAINQGLENTLHRVKTEEFGNLPGGLQDYLKEFEHSLKPIVNWKRILKLFANSSSRTSVKNTLRRPSKRYGTNPGIKVKKKQKILVAIDTSGSISMEELNEFFGEIYHIWKQGAEIMVVECDTAIHQQYLYRGNPPQQVMGRGGTAFEAPIHFANDEYNPDALIYFTDGYGANPDIKSICPMMWLLSSKGAELDSLREFQGRKVKMN